MYQSKRVTVFYGNFGAGKTELAVNFAVYQAARHRRAVLVDLDNVTPFFRSRDIAAELERAHVKVFSSPEAIRKADLPGLAPEVLGVLADPGATAVFDVGGNEWGARVIGSLAGRFPPDELDALFVVNTRRPYSRNVEEILSAMRNIAVAARMPARALVNATNLGRLTTAAIIDEGLAVVCAAGAAAGGLPVAFSACPEWLAPQGEAAEFFRQRGNLYFSVHRYMAPQWEQSWR